MKQEEFKTLSPKLDIVFQKLFGEEGSENITKGLLEAILKRKIGNVDLSKNPILRRENLDGKLGILDVVAKVNEKENVNIEIQLTEKGQERERILYYWGRMYARDLQKGEDYQKLNKTIAIMITNFEMSGLEELGLHTKWQIKDETGTKILTKKLEIHIIELSKIRRGNIMDEELLDWLIFIQNPNSERVKKKMVKNDALREAKNKLDKMSQDEEMQQMAWWREKGILEEKLFEHKKEEVERMQQEIEQGKQEIEQGKQEIEQGKQEIEQGKQEIEQGKQEIEQGKQEIEQEIQNGIQKQTTEIAKNMLAEGIEKEVISKITGLTKEEIQKLK